MKKKESCLLALLMAVLLMSACQDNMQGTVLTQNEATASSVRTEIGSAATVESDTPVITTPEPMEEPATEEKKTESEARVDTKNITLAINGQSFTATLESNETVQALVERLPLTLTMSELNGNEKYSYMDAKLPVNTQTPGQIYAGDIMLYGDDCLVLFYESFSSGYSYTRLGAIGDPAGLKDAVGSGSVTVTLDAA
ncbi:MAG: cyclophilin-like fold protein [Eubacteriales bacterium]|nr:cyclophilin-like fold protein [Eubacteriales bacterium]